MAFGPNLPPIQAHLCVKGGEAAIAFYETAFGAQCTFKAMAEDGKRVMHANLAMFGSEVMLHDEFPEFGGDVMAPNSRGGASIAININLPQPADVDAAIARAASAGADRHAGKRCVLGRPLWPPARSFRPCLGLQRAAERELSVPEFIPSRRRTDSG